MDAYGILLLLINCATKWDASEKWYLQEPCSDSPKAHQWRTKGAPVRTNSHQRAWTAHQWPAPARLNGATPARLNGAPAPFHGAPAPFNGAPAHHQCHWCALRCLWEGTLMVPKGAAVVRLNSAKTGACNGVFHSPTPRREWCCSDRHQITPERRLQFFYFFIFNSQREKENLECGFWWKWNRALIPIVRFLNPLSPKTQNRIYVYQAFKNIPLIFLIFG